MYKIIIKYKNPDKYINDLKKRLYKVEIQLRQSERRFRVVMSGYAKYINDEIVEKSEMNANIYLFLIYLKKHFFKKDNR